MTAAAAEAPRAKVVLVDLSALFWAAWHSSGEEGVSQARVRTLESVKRCHVADALVAICCDGKNGFRKKIAPEYKAQRPERDHASLGELQRTKDRLRADGYLLWEVETFEADDVIATALGMAHERGHEVRICSADKDLMQLLGPGVELMRTHTWKLMIDGDVKKDFGIEASQMTEWLALVGDKSDNIAGCPGVGPKTATALLAKHGTLDGLWEALEVAGPTGRVMTPAVDASLRKSVIAVETAKKLIRLRSDVPIAFDDIYAAREPQRLTTEEESTMPDDETTPDTQTETVQAEPLPAANGNGTNGDHANGKTDAPPTGALVPVAFERGLEPSSIKMAYWLGGALYNSRLYSRFPTADAIFAVILRGREMGLGALTALDAFHVIEGKPAPSAHLIIARAKGDPECEYFMCTESTATAATWETKHRRNPKPSTLRYTIEDAQAAGLTGKGGNWQKRPAEMLRKTAGVQLARMEYPDAALGLYAVEELEGT